MALLSCEVLSFSLFLMQNEMVIGTFILYNLFSPFIALSIL